MVKDRPSIVGHDVERKVRPLVRSTRYLSQLTTKSALASQKQALRYYRHVTTILESDSRDASGLIVLGSVGESSKAARSEGNTAPKPPRGTAAPPPPKEQKPISPPCKLPSWNNSSPPSERPTEPPHVVPASPQPPDQSRPAYCGDTATFGRTLESYVVGNNAQDIFPWNVIITSSWGSTKCVGSLVHKGDLRQVVNSSDVVITAAYCFEKYNPQRVYAGSPIKNQGTMAEIASFALYGLPWQKNQTHAAVAILKLKRPLSRKDNVVPVCLAQRESVPPSNASCYATYYDKNEHRINEEVLLVGMHAHCLGNHGSIAPLFRGICGIVQRKRKSDVQLGSPMVCIVNGRAYQYGIYLKRLASIIDLRVTKDLVFGCEITIVHDVFAGRNVSAALYEVPGLPVPALTSSYSPKLNVSRPTQPPEQVTPVDPKLPRQPTHTIEPGSKRNSSSSVSSSSVSSSSVSSSSADSSLKKPPAAPNRKVGSRKKTDLRRNKKG